MAYEPTQWRSGDTITSERLNKMEQGIASGGSDEFYALHTTITITPAENEGDVPTITYSSVELREDGLPMWLIVDNEIGLDNTTYAGVVMLDMYNNENFSYGNGLTVNRSTGEITSGLGGVDDGGSGGDLT